jgi:adenine-specific DNA-methyltransferase
MKKLFEYDRDKQIKRLKDAILAVKSQRRLFEDDKDKREDEKTIREIESRIEEIKNIDVPGPTEHFEWHINYSEIFQAKGGFDVVIANPPYVGEKGHKEIFRPIADSVECF